MRPLLNRLRRRNRSRFHEVKPGLLVHFDFHDFQEGPMISPPCNRYRPRDSLTNVRSLVSCPECLGRLGHVSGPA